MEQLWNKILAFLPTLGITLLILVVGYFATKLLIRIVRKAFTKTHLDPSLISFFLYAIRFTCYALIVIAALTKLGISTTGLLASFSAAAAAVALALKDKIADLASGIIILITRPFVTGDFIEFGKFKGFVLKIDLIHTKLLTYDDTNIIIPNSRITSNEVNNYTHHPEMRVVLNVPMSYSVNIDDVKRVLLETVNKTEHLLTDEAHTPQVRLEKYGESSLDFSLRCWCNFEDYWTVYFSLTESVKKALDDNHLTIPFNQLDVHIVDQAKAK